MKASQPDLFAPASGLPDGLQYREELIGAAEEAALVQHIAALPFAPFRFHGFEGKRRTVSFGWHYAFDGRGLHDAEPIPEFLLPLRERAAAFAGLDAPALEHVLVIEYGIGAGIGWHRDRSVFGDTIGVSLLSACPLRFRRRSAAGWERRSLMVEPRSVYLLRGPARSEWEHSIVPVSRLRYSVTFRTLAAQPHP